MESTIKLIQDFLNQPYQWLIIEILSILGITDYLKYLIRKFLKETQRRFRDLLCDKALRRSFYRWMGKNYKQLPPWAKKLSRWVERILLRIRYSLRRKNKDNRDKQ